MLDGKSLQAGTSHYLGQNFAKSFDMKFLDKDGVLKYGYSTFVGHFHPHDRRADHGARGRARSVLPPMVAPVQAIVVPVAAHKEGVTEKAKEIAAQLIAADVRAETISGR